MSGITKEFATAGRAVFTLEVPTTFQEQANARPHYTYRVTKKDASEKWGDAWFVALLTGPDNEASYSYLGMLDPASGALKLTRGSKLSADAVPVKLVQRVFARVAGRSRCLRASSVGSGRSVRRSWGSDRVAGGRRSAARV